ncbi:hypothetical protein [Culicoidibacter larvae]|uniref:Uncharacterized protein n=1 Tax=Culicoidibacter larvae TaxID=2579976 RepID=A0A5R8QH41_9FIRM|nr:hypothetical protein [Culicoidibacter larvae]TLG77084.1 hypothetical protein FEZ08_00265 [Culicoidibacter larvae]
MYEKSNGAIMRIVFMQAFAGFGIAIVLWVIMSVYLKVLSDENIVLYIMAVPVILIYLGYAYITKFGKMQYQHGILTITPVIGEVRQFSKIDYDFDVMTREFRLRRMPIASGLVIVVRRRSSGETQKFKLYGYNEDTIDIIIADLEN